MIVNQLTCTTSSITPHCVSQGPAINERGSGNTALHKPTEISGLGSHCAAYQWKFFPTGCTWKADRMQHAAANDNSSSNLRTAKITGIYLPILAMPIVLAQLLTDFYSDYDKDYIGEVHYNELRAHKLGPGPKSIVLFWWHRAHSNLQQLLWCGRVAASHIPQIPIFQSQR